MPLQSRSRGWRCSAAAMGIVLLAALLGKAQAPCGLTMAQLQRMSPCQLAELFDKADVGTPLVGRGQGKLLYRNDAVGAKLKVRLSNVAWRGKRADADGYFINRWIGGREAIDSHYTIGPSWVDGRPAMLMDYPRGTPLLWNMHDELREVAPGLYLGPIFDRYPCPKFRGYLAVQVESCPPAPCCGR